MKMENNKKEMQITPEKVAESIENFFSMCGGCIKSDVCKIKGTEESRCCKSFYSSMNHKRYGNIHDMFKPIFEWINYHYPSGEVRFWVDNNSAKMFLEHGIFVFQDSTFKRVNPFVQSNGASVEVVKHGKMKKLFQCKNCDCEFYTSEYSKDDINIGTMLDVKNKNVWLAVCPECGCICSIDREEENNAAN